jgi:hypothetical protein
MTFSAGLGACSTGASNIPAGSAGAGAAPLGVGGNAFSGSGNAIAGVGVAAVRGAASDAGDASPPAIPFEAPTPASSLTKGKNLLTGLAPTQAELDSVAADPKNLAALVDAWTALPAYAEKMELFFAGSQRLHGQPDCGRARRPKAPKSGALVPRAAL